MKNGTTNVAELAARLDNAAINACAVAQLGDGVSVDQAYQIQAASLWRRYSRGERRVGIKMGFTSRAKMAQMGVDDMIWGRLTDRMLVQCGESLSLKEFIHPRVEPELAFLLGKPLSGIIDPMTAMNAVVAIAPALEIIDSRYRDFKFTLADVIADNSSSSAFAIGPWGDPSTDIKNLGMLLEIDGVIRQIGSSAAILGHPSYSLVAAARLVAERGEALDVGDIVMAGGATAAEPLHSARHVSLTVQNLGDVSFMVIP